MNRKFPSSLSRRGLIGSAIALAASPPARAESGEISAVMRTLSDYMASAGQHALPGAVTEKAKEMILDALAAMISGSQLPPGRFALQFARTYQGNGATVVASRLLCGPVEAALVNGMLAHSDETDDSHPGSQSHPGCSVVSAALAAGERFAIDGPRFLRSVVLGYDIGPRFTATLGKLEYMTSSHRSTHALSGTFGSAAAAGCAAGLNAQQMRWLLSFTAQQASGLATWQRDTQHIEKSFDFAGMSARDGVTAALLVQAGATGVDDVLSGPDNFFAAFGPLNAPAKVADGLGSRYEILYTNVKKWTVGSPIQAPLDALQEVMSKNRLSADQVKAVTVRVATSEAAIVDNRVIPDICLQHMLAVMLTDGTVTFKSAHDAPRMKDPAVLRQRAKVKLVPDAALQKLMPARVADVEVALSDGRTLPTRVSAVRGTFQNPMSREEVVAKARDLIAPVLGAPGATTLIDKIFALEKVKNVLELRPLLQKA